MCSQQVRPRKIIVCFREPDLLIYGPTKLHYFMTIFSQLWAFWQTLNNENWATNKKVIIIEIPFLIRYLKQNIFFGRPSFLCKRLKSCSSNKNTLNSGSIHYLYQIQVVKTSIVVKYAIIIKVSDLFTSQIAVVASCAIFMTFSFRHFSF